jgi:hypothetical protein
VIAPHRTSQHGGEGRGGSDETALGSREEDDAREHGPRTDGVAAPMLSLGVTARGGERLRICPLG